MHTVTIEELKTVIALSDLPDVHLQWILDHCEYYEYEDGTLIRQTGEIADTMFFILEGKVDFYLNVNGQLVYYFCFMNDSATGGVSGLLPYSRMKVNPGNSFAVGKVRALHLHKDHFSELERLNPDFIQRLIGYMTERARAFATTQMQHEKVSALGRLSAGIAHELNNPASAIGRIASELTNRLQLNYDLTEKLLQHTHNAEVIHRLRDMVNSKHHAASSKLTMHQRMEREDDIVQWLEQHQLSDYHEVADTFAEAGFSSADVEALLGAVGAEAYGPLLLWLENLLGSQKAIEDLESASARISNLVGAIKSHVHMDRTNELQPTDIHTDIENTLTLLGHKLREKNITVKRQFSEHLPPVSAYVGELNQVWTNLIDNAVYALGQGGELVIETSHDDKHAYVKVIDNGSGIPAEIQSRIFDPFFTTKKVGEGTGIGLDLVNRILKHHHGDIKVYSQPGRTEFLVRLPLGEKKVEVTT